jgi:Restriction endonuclease
MFSFSLNQLDETQFEEFCFELLGELGFVNINWRKGTGLSSSPSDRGRDIECQRKVTDLIGNKYLERWFVECKHYEKGVPPDKIQGLLAWATAERPDHVLIIASNFLSNPTKDFLEGYKKNNNPPFKIYFWERPQLEKLTVGKTRLLNKYNIAGEFAFLNYLHPAHMLYLRKWQPNTLGYFLKVLDKLDPALRDKAMAWAYFFVIAPRHREPVTDNETFGELLIDDVSYQSFKEKCHLIVASGLISEPFLISAIVNFTLQNTFQIGDETAADDFIKQHQLRVTQFQELLDEVGQHKTEQSEMLADFINFNKQHNPYFDEGNIKEDLEFL